MASGKRASMREGPLAALFRKTEEDGLHGEGVPPAKPEEPQPQQARPREEFRSPTGGVHESPVQPEPAPSHRPEPQPAARREPEPEPELRPAPPSARRPQPSATPSPREVADAARREEADAERERRERRAARTPEQRLREVFSTDIPENIM